MAILSLIGGSAAAAAAAAAVTVATAAVTVATAAGMVLAAMMAGGADLDDSVVAVGTVAEGWAFESRVVCVVRAIAIAIVIAIITAAAAASACSIFGHRHRPMSNDVCPWEGEYSLVGVDKKMARERTRGVNITSTDARRHQPRACTRVKV
jgi:hypothetical protein